MRNLARLGMILAACVVTGNAHDNPALASTEALMYCHHGGMQWPSGNWFSRNRIRNPQAMGGTTEAWQENMTGGIYYSDTDEYVPSEGGSPTSGDDAYDAYDVNWAATAYTDGTDADTNVVGTVIYRKKDPYGDLFLKGWFGSDEYDDLTFNTDPNHRSTFKMERWWTWPDLPHTGLASLENRLEVETMVQDIGTWHWLQAGTVTPRLDNSLINFGIGGGGNTQSTLSYAHNLTSVYTYTLSGNGNVSTSNGVGASVGLTVGGSVAITNPILTSTGLPNLVRSGSALMPCANEVWNTQTASLYTNDCTTSWELKSENTRRQLESMCAH